MAVQIDWVKRPAPSADYRAAAPHRVAGPVIGLIGLGVLTATLVANVAAADRLATDPGGAARILTWSFGASTAARRTVAPR